MCFETFRGAGEGSLVLFDRAGLLSVGDVS